MDRISTREARGAGVCEAVGNAVGVGVPVAVAMIAAVNVGTEGRVTVEIG